MHMARGTMVAAALLCASCKPISVVDSAAVAPGIVGTAAYLERMALLPDDVFEATLEDVSLADAPAAVLGRVHLSPAGQPPIRFTLAYDAASVAATHRYAVRARILRGGQLLFITDTTMEVDLAHPAPVDLLLRRVVASPPAPAAGVPAVAVLENTYWKLMSLDGKAVVVGEGQREPHLVLQPGEHRVAGFGGCNTMMGSYLLDADRLSFRQMAGTLMACMQGMEAESAFHAALLKVMHWRISGEMLELTDSSGKPVATFESRYMR